MSDEDAGAAAQAPVPALARIVAGGPKPSPEAFFWTHESRAPADLLERVATAAGRSIVLTGGEFATWTEDLHRTYAMLVMQGVRLKDDDSEPSAGEQLGAAVAGANTLVGDLLRFMSSSDTEVRRTAHDAARALVLFRMAAEAAQPALARPGTKTKTLRQHVLAQLIELYRRGFGVEPSLSRGGPLTRFVSTMFVAAGAEHLSDNTLYNIIGQARALKPRKD